MVVVAVTVVVCAVVMGARCTDAVLPPLSEAELAARADAVVEGHIVEVKSHEVPAVWKDSTNTVYALRFKVTSVVHGDVETDSDSTITVGHWRPGARPRGWVGDVGSRSQGDVVVTVTDAGSQLRLYLAQGPLLLNKVSHDYVDWHILTPNGSTVLATPAHDSDDL